MRKDIAAILRHNIFNVTSKIMNNNAQDKFSKNPKEVGFSLTFYSTFSILVHVEVQFVD